MKHHDTHYVADSDETTACGLEADAFTTTQHDESVTCGLCAKAL